MVVVTCDCAIFKMGFGVNFLKIWLIVDWVFGIGNFYLGFVI